VNHLVLLLLLGFIGRAHADVGLYDAIGRPIALPTLKLPGLVTRNAAGLPATVTIGDLDTTYTYNAHGEVLTETTTNGQGVVFARAYTRDALGRITQVEETEGANTRKLFYNYDIAGRLVAECQGTAVGQGEIDDPCGEDTALIAEYTYDANGNRLSRDEPGGDVDEEAEYDAQDRLVDYDGVAHTFGDRGELQAAGTWSFDYDAMGNLVQASKPGLTVSYLIDPQNRRIGRTVGNDTRYWLYQEQLRLRACGATPHWGDACLRHPIAELDGTGALVARFVYGTRAYSPDYMIRFEGANQVLYRFVTDHLGSVRMVVKVSTGAVVQRLDYDAFGRVLDDTNPGFQPFGFAGGLHDADTGLVRFGARDYDPYTGRWTAKDPICWEGGQANLYEYVSSDPVNVIDPEGLQQLIGGPYSLEWFGREFGLTGAVVGAYSAIKDAQDFAITTAAGGAALKAAGWAYQGARAWFVSRCLPAAAEGFTFGASSVGASQVVPTVLQTGGRTLKQRTANVLNDYFGLNHPKRVWGGALEELKRDLSVPNDHHGKLLSNGDYLDEAGEFLGNVFQYLF
jgi:RHS repeat-associated protein